MPIAIPVCSEIWEQKTEIKSSGRISNSLADFLTCNFPGLKQKYSLLRYGVRLLRKPDERIRRDPMQRKYSNFVST
jgi:hypothetical protein